MGLPTQCGPNIRVTPLSRQLIELSSELEALGGGDTRVGAAEVFTRTHCSTLDLGATSTPSQEADQARTLLEAEDHVAVRGEKGVRRFDVTRALSRHASQQDVYDKVGASLLEWLWQGFNANLVAYGQQGTGKTYSLLSPGRPYGHHRKHFLGAKGG